MARFVHYPVWWCHIFTLYVRYMCVSPNSHVMWKSVILSSCWVFSSSVFVVGCLWLTAPVYTTHTSRVQLLTRFLHFSTRRWRMESADTCSCSLCNKFYTYLYHHTVLSDSTHSSVRQHIQFCQTVHKVLSDSTHSSVRQYTQFCQTVHTLQYSLIINTTGMKKLMIIHLLFKSNHKWLVGRVA